MFYTAESGGVRTYLTAKGNWLARQTSIEHVVVAPSMIEAKGARFIGVPSLPIPYAKGYRMPLSCRIAAHKIQQLQPDLIEVGDPYQLAWAALRVRDRTEEAHEARVDRRAASSEELARPRERRERSGRGDEPAARRQEAHERERDHARPDVEERPRDVRGTVQRRGRRLGEGGSRDLERQRGEPYGLGRRRTNRISVISSSGSRPARASLRSP